MKITNDYTGFTGIKYLIEYQDTDDFSVLPYEKCTQCYGVCFTGNNDMVIVYHGEKKHWGLVGGTIESGETFDQTLIREILEESNMKVIKYVPLGYQKVTDTRDGSYIYQLRFMCNVEPIGPFVSDPAGSISEIKLIEPKDYKKYFDWGTIGERIVERAMEKNGML